MKGDITTEVIRFIVDTCCLLYGCLSSLLFVTRGVHTMQDTFSIGVSNAHNRLHWVLPELLRRLYSRNLGRFLNLDYRRLEGKCNLAGKY